MKTEPQRLLFALFVASTILCRDVAYAEPLFFDCHGTTETRRHNENLEHRERPWDSTAQVVIDPEKGVASYPGGGEYLNKYCDHESDWIIIATSPQGQASRKIKECTTLEVSELIYKFTTTTEIKVRVKLPGSDQERMKHHVLGGSEGSLNRITGKLSVEQRYAPIDKPDDVNTNVWEMTCSPTKRKF
jgi:hypothetical protein